jgi:hypothetical protein
MHTRSHAKMLSHAHADAMHITYTHLLLKLLVLHELHSLLELLHLLTEGGREGGRREGGREEGGREGGRPAQARQSTCTPRTRCVCRSLSPRASLSDLEFRV